MEIKLHPETFQKIEPGRNTADLIALWKVINHDQKPITNLGQIKANIIAAAIEKGIRAGQIEIAWHNDKQPKPPQVTKDEAAKKVVVAIDQKSLAALEKSLDGIMPDGISPYVEDPGQYYQSVLKKTPPEKRTTLNGLAPINQTIVDIYNHWLTI